MLNFFCRKKGGLKFTLFYTFFTNKLSKKGTVHPVSQSSPEAISKVPDDSLLILKRARTK